MHEGVGGDIRQGDEECLRRRWVSFFLDNALRMKQKPLYRPGASKVKRLTCSIKYTPAVVSANVTSLKIRQSGQILLATLPFSGRGNRERIKKFATTQKKRRMKARIRVVHLKPTFGKSLSNINGKTMPPTLPPVVASPTAVALLTAKKCAIDEMAGVNMRAVPMPLVIEYESKKCHNSGKDNGLIRGG